MATKKTIVVEVSASEGTFRREVENTTQAKDTAEKIKKAIKAERERLGVRGDTIIVSASRQEREIQGF
jgi:hypothetical protein